MPDPVAALESALDSEFLAALAEPTRVHIIRLLLREGALDVTALAEQLPQERSVISRHLKVLHAAHLVRVTKDGRHRVYSLAGGVFVGRLQAILDAARACVASCCPEELDS